MECTVVAISRTLGAGGEDLGQLLATELGFRYVDAEIITAAAERAGVSPDTVAKAEAPKSLVARIIEGLARTNAGSLYSGAEFTMAPAEYTISYENVITQVIRETAGEGKVVIVAHGASIPLAGLPGLVRVMVTASPAVRAARVAAAEGLSESKAADAIHASDRARADYFRRFYGVDHELPTHYDIVVNTDNAGVAEAQRAILALIRG